MAIGRRTDLTPELQERICKLIRDNGMYLEPAAAACGVAHATLYEWLARGRSSSSNSRGGLGEAVEPGTHGRGDPDGLYADFADAINKAEGELEVMAVSAAVKKFKKSRNPLAPIIFLSRRFRDRWSEQIQLADAGREVMATMERYKAAWDAPEVVDGECRVIEGGTMTPALEAATSNNDHSANLSEASGFHLPPPGALDALDAQVVETTDDEDVDQDGDDADIEGQAPMHPGAGAASLPTPLPRQEKVVHDDSTPAEISEIKSEEETDG